MLPRLVCVRRACGTLTADPASDFWQSVAPSLLRENLTGAAPQQATELRIVWDAEELRVLFHAHDTYPWATLAERDGPLWEEEVVEVFLDPTGDGECYFEIEVNPLNTVLDLVLRRNRSGYKKDLAWNCENFRSSVAHTPAGWTAEMSIPFRSIAPDPPRGGAVWRANFLRIDRPPNRDRELSAWSPTHRPTFHAPERFGTLFFE
jgi:hypothetical protein